MITRDLEKFIRRTATWYPVVTVTGPRQSGKTTLCRHVFAEKPYVNLEPIDVRESVRSDPRGFLDHHPTGAVIDEVQHVPELLSYLQASVDEDDTPGRFVLTGSQHFGMSASVAQSLAGRTAMLQLLPPSLRELRRFQDAPRDLMTTLVTGAYPRIHDRGIPAERWFSDYLTTYVQRDVRQVLEVQDLLAFTTFLKLCAGRTGQELNLSSLGADAGISHNTARKWLSVLEASFLCLRIPPWLSSPRKRLVKAPKLHFLDAGLACHLLGIRDAEQLRHHPSRGAIFESFVVSELVKAHTNAGIEPSIRHYRESRGLEVDALVESRSRVYLVEAKSGATIHGEFLEPLKKLAERLATSDESRSLVGRLIHGGDLSMTREGQEVVPWSALADLSWLE